MYFDLDLDRLITLAERAAEVGAERYVLDDGWFVGRRSDNAGLGDWQVDPETLAGWVCIRWSIGSPRSAWSSGSGWNPR